MTLREYKKLSNAALLDRLDVLLTQTRSNLTELIVCMGEVERRALFAAAGYSSMHAYCVDVFHMSDDEAYADFGHREHLDRSIVNSHLGTS